MTEDSKTPVPDRDKVLIAAAELILSASGWRKIFAGDGEEDASPDLAPVDNIVVGAMAMAFCDAVSDRGRNDAKPLVAVAMDSRPTGPSIADIIIRILVSKKLTYVSRA